MFRKLIGVAVVASASILSGSATIAQEDLGESAYMQYCATCHGASGKGDGPLTQLMTTRVSDLTQLSARNDGEFPMWDVLQIVDGRTGIAAHGGPMPVYGALFDEEAGELAYGSVYYTRAKILSLANYIETLQAE